MIISFATSLPVCFRGNGNGNRPNIAHANIQFEKFFNKTKKFFFVKKIIFYLDDLAIEAMITKIIFNLDWNYTNRKKVEKLNFQI